MSLKSGNQQILVVDDFKGFEALNKTPYFEALRGGGQTSQATAGENK